MNEDVENDERYRQQKIDFVSGLDGGTVGELVLLMTIPSLGMVLCHALSSEKVWRTLLVEWLLLFALPAFSYMYPDHLSMLFCTLVVLIIVQHRSSFSFSFSSFSSFSSSSSSFSDRPPSLGALRAALMISTCIAILAVDFSAFPRRFAKTETFGISLMDLGVGSFVFARGLVSSSSSSSFSIWKAIFSTFPLLVLGFIRLLTVKSSNYAEHVSEYGVHWNFFFTLAAISLWGILSSHCRPLSNPLSSALLLCFHQSLLSSGGSSYVFDHPRTSLVHMNKEGLVSLLGYCTLFSFGRDFVHFLRSTRLSPLLITSLLATLSGALGYLAHLLIEPCSRRLVNAAYILTTTGFNLFFLATMMLVYLLFIPPSWSPRLFVSLNRNQLVVFLVANVLTGLTNVSLDTLSFSHHQGVLIVQLYLVFLTFFVFVIRSHSFKFW